MMLLAEMPLCTQALARDAGEGSNDYTELAALNDEADMPLDQLLAQYGFVTGEDAQQKSEGSPAAGTSASLARVPCRF